MRILETVNPLDRTAATDAHAAGQSRPVAVKRDDQRFIKTARVVRVCRMAEVVLDALQTIQQPELLQCRLELLLPFLVEGGRLPPPSARTALCDVAGDNAFMSQNPVGQRLDHAFVEPLVRRPKTRDLVRPLRYLDPGCPYLR